MPRGPNGAKRPADVMRDWPNLALADSKQAIRGARVYRPARVRLKSEFRERKALAIAPQSQRHVCQILLSARSLLRQSRRMSPFRRSVSAAKNSVPGSSFGDGFDHCVGSMQFGPDRLHHPVFPNRGNRRRSKRRRFCGDLAAYFQRSRSLPTLTVSQVDFWPRFSA
jgi:hypothetical protein